MKKFTKKDANQDHNEITFTPTQLAESKMSNTKVSVGEDESHGIMDW